MGGPILIVDYNPHWPELYQLEAGRISAALGNVLVQIEHIGST